jgi:hypothetical protein
MSVINSAAMKLLLLAVLFQQVAAYVYYSYYPTTCRYNVCRSYTYGYYCCDSYWYGSGWAIFLYVFFGILLLTCFAWCCIAMLAEPTPTRVYPADQVYVVKSKKTSTQPAPVTGTVGKATELQGGSYTVEGQPVSEAPSAVQGVAVDEPSAPPVNVNVNVTYPELAPPVQTV